MTYYNITIFTKMDLKEHEDSLKTYRDMKNFLDTAEAKGRAEGIAKVARRMLAMGMTADYIADVTRLSKKEIKDIADRQEAKDRS